MRREITNTFPKSSIGLKHCQRLLHLLAGRTYDELPGLLKPFVRVLAHVGRSIDFSLLVIGVWRFALIDFGRRAAIVTIDRVAFCAYDILFMHGCVLGCSVICRAAAVVRDLPPSLLRTRPFFCFCFFGCT